MLPLRRDQGLDAFRLKIAKKNPELTPEPGRHMGCFLSSQHSGIESGVEWSEVSAWDIDERKVRLNSIYVLDWSPISTRIEASRHRPGLSIVQFYELCMGNLSVEGLSSREMDFVLTTMAANPDHSGTSVEAYDGLR